MEKNSIRVQSRTIYNSKDNKVSADKGIDLDMNENLMKLLGEVEILSSGGYNGR